MRKAHLIEVDFYDHVQSRGDTAGLIICRVWGLLFFEDKKEIRICTWLAENDPTSANSDILSIAKSTIVRRRRL